MRLLLTIVSGFAATHIVSAIPDDIIPPRFTFNRYIAMLDHSPFAVATAVALPQETPDFAKDLYVANAAHSSEGDMVTIGSTADQNFKKYLTTRNTVDGYSITSIEWSDRVGATKVTISKDGNLATLTFNQALLSQAAPAGPSASGEVPPTAHLLSPTAKRTASQGHGHRVAQQASTAAAAPAPVVTPSPIPDVPSPPAAEALVPPVPDEVSPLTENVAPPPAPNAQLSAPPDVDVPEPLRPRTGITQDEMDQQMLQQAQALQEANQIKPDSKPVPSP